jgi:D-sedoheptulose 7-phosphate isomerase
MDSVKYIGDYLSGSIETKKKLLACSGTIKVISDVAELLIAAYARGNKLLIAGNGGSAADAQHIAAEFVSRFLYDRPGLPAIALTTDTSMLTAIGNDYGFENLFARQVEAQAKEGDIFIGISTSGNSVNIIKAVEAARHSGVTSIALCGEQGELRNLADIAICVPSSSTPYIQEAHICIAHVICAIVEAVVFPQSEK